MANSKYVVIKGDAPYEETMFIFPDYIKHKAFTCNMCHHPSVVSAGFIALRRGELLCYGESITLGKRARPEDGKLANDMMGGNG